MVHSRIIFSHNSLYVCHVEGKTTTHAAACNSYSFVNDNDRTRGVILADVKG